jgi:hypothetical protein
VRSNAVIGRGGSIWPLGIEAVHREMVIERNMEIVTGCATATSGHAWHTLTLARCEAKCGLDSPAHPVSLDLTCLIEKNQLWNLPRNNLTHCVCESGHLNNESNGG